MDKIHVCYLTLVSPFMFFWASMPKKDTSVIGQWKRQFLWAVTGWLILLALQLAGLAAQSQL